MADTDRYLWHRDPYEREASLAWRRCTVMFAARGQFTQTHPVTPKPKVERFSAPPGEDDKGEGGVPLPPA